MEAGDLLDSVKSGDLLDSVKIYTQEDFIYGKFKM